jgi:DNA-binding CsgD family transcriptional regulator
MVLDWPAVPAIVSELIGRVDECAQLDAMLDRTRHGRSGALVLRGEPGVGKSRLLDFAVERASDFRVLRALGVESESDIPFSALLELVRPVVGRIDALPARQRRALESALALGGSEGVERFAVAAATLGLLALAADELPLLCIVDDVQWIDAASRETLLFAARRLADDRVAMLFGARDSEATYVDTPGLDGLVVTGLAASEARALVAATAQQPLAVAVVTSLIAATGGNPLALIEVPQTLREAQRVGEEPLDDPLRPGAAVERAFGARVLALSEGAQRALRLAAASDSTELGPLLAAAGGDAPALDEAEAAGLISVADDAVWFRHPLVRSAIHARATAGERRAAHLALADALDPIDHDRATWHRAWAVVGYDEALAADLAAVGERSRRRGGAEAHARLLDRAARLTSDPEQRAGRLHAAGRAAYDAGRVEYASALLDEALTLAGTPALRADILEARVETAKVAGQIGDWIDRCRDGADAVAARDPVRASRLLFHIWDYHAEQHEVPEGRAVMDEMLALMGGAEDRQVIGASGWQAMMEDRVGDARAAAMRVLELAGGAADERVAEMPFILAYIGDVEQAAAAIEPVVAQFRRDGAVLDLVKALIGLSVIERCRGRYSSAGAAATEAIALSQDADIRYLGVLALSVLVTLESELGAPSGAGHARLIIETAPAVGQRGQSATATAALGRLALVAGRNDEAIQLLERVRDEIGGMRARFTLWEPELVEAYARAGRRQEACHALDAFEGRARAAGHGRSIAVAARCRAMLAEDRIGDAFAEAIALLQGGPWPLDLARCELLYGERLRRSGQRATARTHLHRALDRFEEHGAVGFAERVRDELRASGEAARRSAAESRDELTPQELQIATLVARGGTNREVAAGMFLSPKTVEKHLSSAYRKLGVRSRTELARLLVER